MNQMKRGEKAAEVLKDDKAIKREDDKCETEIVAISRHSERERRNPADKAAFTLAEGATHVAHCDKSRRVAFTLAEVLITLGIIGVVAALTLPTVIQNYRKQETVAQLQKTYSTVNQALLQSIAENGDYINFDNATDDIGDEAFFKKYWLPYFKGATICNEQNLCGYRERGLLPSTFYCLNGILANGAGVSGNPLYITAIHYGRSTIMLPDGSVVIYFNGYGDNNQERLNTSWVLIDVNGGKEPNTYGKDVFFFDRNEKGAIVPRCKNLTKEQVNSDCSKTGTGECCAQKIINDGWKINY